MENITPTETYETYKSTQYKDAVDKLEKCYVDYVPYDQQRREILKNGGGAALHEAFKAGFQKKSKQRRANSRKAWDTAVKNVASMIRNMATGYLAEYDKDGSVALRNFDELLTCLAGVTAKILAAVFAAAQNPNGIGLDWYFRNQVVIGNYFPGLENTDVFGELKSTGANSASGLADLAGGIGVYCMLNEAGVLPADFKKRMVRAESNIAMKKRLEMMFAMESTEKKTKVGECKALKEIQNKLSRRGAPLAQISDAQDATELQRCITEFIERMPTDWFILYLRLAATGKLPDAAEWHVCSEDQKKAAAQAGRILVDTRARVGAFSAVETREEYSLPQDAVTSSFRF